MSVNQTNEAVKAQKLYSVYLLHESKEEIRY